MQCIQIGAYVQYMIIILLCVLMYVRMYMNTFVCAHFVSCVCGNIEETNRNTYMRIMDPVCF